MNYDVIVVGGGAAGSVTAWTAARNGLRVAVVERQNRESLAQDKMGEAVEPDLFSDLGLPEPAGAELIGHVRRYRIYSPRRIAPRDVNHHHLAVDRRLLDRRLLDMAERAGVTVHDGTEVVGIQLQEHGVTGVVGSGHGGEAVWTAHVTVDASGSEGVIRRWLPVSMGIDSRFPPEGYAHSYRLTYNKLSGPIEEVDVLLYGGGIYLWRSAFDVGLRAFEPAEDLPEMLRQFAHEQGLAPDRATRFSTAGLPLGRHINSLVADGVLILGDAAGMCNPTTGYGVTTGMLAGKMASEVAVAALRRGRADRESLWPFNLQYNARWGANHASLDVLRCFLRNLGAEELDYLWQHHLLAASDLEVAFNGELVVLSLAEKLRRLARASREIGFLIDLERCMELGKKARRLYENYPRRPQELPAWGEKVDKLYGSIPQPQLAR